MCTPPMPQTHPQGINTQLSFGAAQNLLNPLPSRLCRVRKVSCPSHPAFFSPPECPSFQSSGAATSCLPQRQKACQLGAELGTVVTARVCFQIPSFAGRQLPAATLSFRPSKMLGPGPKQGLGHDQGMTMCWSTRLGALPSQRR